MEFREAWGRVGLLEGRTFTTDRDQTFTYRFRKTYVLVEPGGHSIPRTNFEKVFRRRGGEEAGPAVQGQRYIQAVFADPSFRD